MDFKETNDLLGMWLLFEGNSNKECYKLVGRWSDWAACRKTFNLSVKEKSWKVYVQFYISSLLLLLNYTSAFIFSRKSQKISSKILKSRGQTLSCTLRSVQNTYDFPPVNYNFLCYFSITRFIKRHIWTETSCVIIRFV